MEWVLSGWQLVLAFFVSVFGSGGLTAMIVARVNAQPNAMREGTAALTSIISTLRDELRATTDRLEDERQGRAKDDIDHADLRQTLQRMESALIAAETLISEWQYGPPDDLEEWQERAMRWLTAHRTTRHRDHATIRTVEKREKSRLDRLLGKD